MARRGTGWTLLVAAALAVASAAGAQPAQTAPQTSITVVEARVTGDGPWTSWWGGPAHRSLLLTLENTGTTPATDVAVTLAVGKGEPTRPIAAPPIPTLAPGERITIAVDVTLPRFSFGTHAVEGVVDSSVPFRAETSHVPWLLLFLPAIVLGQVVLVSLRNRARAHLRATSTAGREVKPVAGPAPETAAEAAPPVVTERASLAEPGPRARPPVVEPIWSVIERELDAALAGLTDRDGDEEDATAAVHDAARTVTERIADRFEILPDQRPQLARSITTALLRRSAGRRIAS